MAEVSSKRRKAANELAVTAPAVPEREHLRTCEACGQQFDPRNLGDVLHHEMPGHTPLPEEPAPEVLRFIPPLMPTLADEPPEGAGWIHEIKYDGYRTQIHVHEGRVRAYTRNAYDWTERYHPLVAAAASLPCRSSILDGEVIVQDEQGRSDFAAIRSTIAERPEELVFMAFDLLHLNGRDLRKLPLEERREKLRQLIGEADPRQPIHFSEHIAGIGAEVFAAADRMGLEGIVSKRLGSRYCSGPSKNWLKVKTFTEEEFLVIGTSKGDRAPVALLAREDGGALTYAGGAMVTLPQPERDRFWQTAEKLRASEPPLPMEPRKETGWLRPGLRVRVRTLRGEEPVRHATVKAILGEEPSPEPLRRRKAPVRPSAEPHLPNPKIDRAALRRYYEAIAPIMLPWVGDRPSTCYAAPAGPAGSSETSIIRQPSPARSGPLSSGCRWCRRTVEPKSTSLSPALKGSASVSRLTRSSSTAGVARPTMLRSRTVW